MTLAAAGGTALAAEPILGLRNVSLHFDDGRTKALDGVDFAVDEGEFVAIAGPSGSGKSSLLNLIGALDVPSAGEIFFRGAAYSGNADLAAFRGRHIGFVFQSFHLIPTLTALENVMLPALGRSWSAAAQRRRAESLLADMGLRDRLHSSPTTLSGGERQRVAIARALINEPSLILADEPTGSLDSANAEQVLEFLVGLRAEKGLTVVMVTHDEGISARADRVIRMRDGRIERAGQPA